jgi:hypothetical protein
VASQNRALLIAVNAELPRSASGKAAARGGHRETPMADLHETANQQSKEQVTTADLAFVAFVVIITTIPIVLTLTQIYLQNPR